MKKFLYTTCFIFGLAFSAQAVHAATEFVSTIDPDNALGTDYSNLSTWANVCECDLTSASTSVFSYSVASGTIPDLANVQGEDSGATASTTHMTASTTSAQILLTNVTGNFQSGETLYIQGQATSTTYVILSDTGDSAIAVAKCRSTGGSADTSAVTVGTGWTTSATNYIKIWTDPDDEYGRHGGKWDSGKYRLESSTSNALVINEENTKIDGLQVLQTYSGTNIRRIVDIVVTSGTGVIDVSNNIIKAVATDTISGIWGIGVNSGSTGERIVKIYNNIIYNITTPGNLLGNAIHLESNNPTTYIYNNTLINSFNGIRGDSRSNVVVKNNIAQVINNGYPTGLNSASDYNISNIAEDTTGGVNDKHTTTVTFADETNDDFHLSLSDTSAKNAGTSLFFDSNLAITDDIDGTSRGGAWDIGADEVGVEYVSTICENTSAGGDCADMDYSSLGGTGNWEDKVECDLTLSTTRVFSGSITGALNENATVNLCNGATDLNIDGVVVATTSDQILIDNITGTTTPVVAESGWLWSDEACGSAVNYWTIATTTEVSSLDGLGASPIAVAMIDGSWSGADENAVVISSTPWVTDNDNYIKIYTTDLARHDGKWNGGRYRLAQTNSAAFIPVLAIQDANVRVIGLQIDQQADKDHAGSHGIETGDTTGEIQIISNIIRATGVETPSGIYGLELGGGSGKQVAVNNIIYDFYHGLLFTYPSDNPTFVIYNNTVVDNTNDGLTSKGTSVCYLKNNLSYNNGLDYDIVGVDVSSNNLSKDATSPDDAFDNKIVSFVASSTDDFHLASTDTSAKDTGADLSSDPYINFTDDIDGSTRIGSWDIGADEVGYNIYRSVGTTATDLKNAATVTISGTTATFSAAQPDNVGVGDVLQYGGAGYYQLAFITGRTSDTVYSVHRRDALQCVSTTTAAVSIFRAYTSLSNWESQTENTNFDDTVENFDSTTDLVASGTVMNVACYGDGIDTTAVTIDGWTTGAQNYIKIYTPVYSWEVGTSQRHGGKWDEGKYRLEQKLIVYDDFTRIQGLQIKGVSSGNPSIIIDVDISDGGEIQISDNILKGNFTTSDTPYGIHLRWSASGSKTAKIWNNIIYDVVNGTNPYAIYSGGNYTSYIYNNTIHNCYYGISRNNGTFIVKNNLIQNCTIGFDGVFNPNSSHNLSDDATYASSTADTINTEVTFVDETNNDFHLSPTDTAAIDAGTDLSSDSNLSFSDDVDGNERRQWDIGADEASVYFESYIQQTGGDHSSLFGWEAANQCDLTATTTAVFSISSASGTIPFHSSVTGLTSGATASTTVVSTSSNQMLLYNISGTFESGEQVYYTQDVHYAVISDNGNPAIAVAHIDGAWTVADETAVNISGWTTGEYNYIRVYTTDEARHGGKWDDGKYRLESGSACIVITEDFVRIEGLQTQVTSTANYRYGISMNVGDGSDIRISYNIVKGIFSGTANNFFGIYGYWESTGSRTAKIWNNIVYGWINGTNDGNGLYGRNTWTFYTYNNTIHNCYRGIRQNGIIVAKNNIVQDCTDGFFGTFTSSDYNISDLAGDAPGSNSKNSTTVAFRDETNDDFRIALTDTSAKNAGTDLSSDSNLAFSTDMEGHNRLSGVWDIGADEAPEILYRSVGNHSTDLNTGSATVTIASTTLTATFSAGMPNNVGVGDVLQFGNSGYYDLAFITGRTSSTTYSVSAWDGAAPSATTTAAVSVYRAHLHLDDWEDHDETINDVNSGIDDSVDDYVILFDTDLVASNTAMFVPCYASTTADDLAVTINGWTTGTSSYIKIFTPVSSSEVGESQRHEGLWNDSKYRLEISNNDIINIAEDYVRIDGLQIRTIAGDSDGDNVINVPGSSVSVNNDIRISNSILRGHKDNTYYQHILSFNDTDAVLRIWNNIIYDQYIISDNSRGMLINCASAYIYNNTIIGGYFGIRRNSGTIIAKNNLVASTTNSYYGTFAAGTDYNATDSSDDIGQGSNNKINQTFSFVDEANDDFHLASSDISARDAGINLSSDIYLSFTDDIDGTARENVWDIGAHELLPKPKYRFSPGGSFKMEGYIKFE